MSLPQNVNTDTTVLPRPIYRPHGIPVKFSSPPRSLPWLPRYYRFPRYHVILYCGLSVADSDAWWGVHVGEQDPNAELVLDRLVQRTTAAYVARSASDQRQVNYPTGYRSPPTDAHQRRSASAAFFRFTTRPHTCGGGLSTAWVINRLLLTPFIHTCTHTYIQGGGPKKWATTKWSENRIKACQW